ncbi:cation diffusion facilitator family transporter [Gimesia benthica]|uniref:Cation diffusion facilitator family transporter n=1 Tax=Gimesia benthica TaxID=2608982 RepID=A0A6I6AA28_9PLAN|nr:cation diffusion facilitator family transporter [Gimesia benthica]QGQ22918.1 cation diffusion facilitator family transporter [Gimesia benthica]
MAQSNSRFAVVAALTGNALITIAKGTTFLITGSGAMLSETIHSVADFLNQLLLLIGLVRADRVPDRRYEYGYAGERYVWALISAVGIFFLGCGVTLYHGVQSLFHPPELDFGEMKWAIAALLFALVIDGVVFFLALKTEWKNAQKEKKAFHQYLRKEADPASVAVILEDGAACLGVMIALISILLTKMTGSPYWDAIGSIGIGVLLGGIAVWLIIRNQELLVGPSIPQETKEQVQRILKNNPLIDDVLDLRSRILSIDNYRIKVDLSFDPKELSKRLKKKALAAYPQIQSEQDFEEFCQKYTRDILDTLAEEIDKIEAEIQRQVPEAKHLDLEAN